MPSASCHKGNPLAFPHRAAFYHKEIPLGIPAPVDLLPQVHILT